VKVIFVVGQNGAHSYVEEAPSRSLRQWRCTADGWVIAAPADPAQIDAFIQSVINHSVPHAGQAPHIHEIHT
jgi:hypothetical protein